MFHPIHNWTDGFIAVRKRAITTRGAIELDDGPKWPRTTGDDVVLIAALFDPSVRASATAGLVRRWRSTLDAIERSALAAPGDTYSDNRAFWNTLELAAVTLDDQAAPVPDSDVWQRLTDELGTRPRNASDASDEHYTLEDRTILRDGEAIMKLSRVDLGDERYAVAPYDFDHLARRIVRLLNGKRPRNARDPRIDALAVYVEMGRELRAKRGAVPAAEITGLATGNAQIPRLTNGDALRIAAFWGEWLADTPTDSGDELQARWRGALDDVAALAVPGDPDASYPNTIELWRMCGAVAAHISDVTESATKQNARNAGATGDDDENDLDDDAAADDNIDHDDPIESFIALRSEMLDACGCDERTASPDAGYAGAFSIPRTTLGDVQRIAGDWSERLAGPLGTSNAMKAIGEVARETWRRARRHVEREAKAGDPDTVYEHNNEFWRALTVLAATLSAVYEVERKHERTRNAPSSYGWLDQVMQRIDPLGIYVAFVQHYSAERGTDVLAPPPGFGGMTRHIPRTTNHDVLTIAAWCSDALADTPHVPGTTGDEITHWAAAVADVNAIAWRGDPDELYLHNNEFWRALAQVVTLMSATDDVRYGRLSTAPRNAPPPPPPFGPFSGITKYDEIYNAQKALLRKQRGEDTLAPPAGFGGMTIPIPRTTNADVTTLATWWDAVWTDAADQLANLADHASASATLKPDWTATLAAVSAAKSADPSAPYAHNNEFWRVLGRLSTEISVAIEAPTWTDIAKDTIENYPATLAHAAGQAAHGVGDALSAVGGYLVDQLKKPLIIGGVALGGLYLLTRNREER